MSKLGCAVRIGRDVRVTLLTVALLLAACASHSPLPESGSGARVWPPPPAAPRIAYVKQFSSPSDLGIRMGFLDRLRGFFTGRGEVGMVRPMAIVVTPQNVCYVADPGRSGIHEFDLGKGTYTFISGPDGKGLPSPVGLALGEGVVYVTDSYLGRVYRIDSGGRSAVALDLEDPPEQPTGIAVDAESGNLYIVDTARHQVDVYAPSGARMASFGRRGSGPGEFNYPTMIWLTDAGRLLVTDSMNFRVSEFDLEGRVLGSFGSHGDGTGDLSRPKGIATDTGGHIYLVDALFHVFQIFDNEGKFLLTVGASGGGIGEFLLPTGIYITRDDTVYVCDSQNHRVEVFRYIGD